MPEPVKILDMPSYTCHKRVKAVEIDRVGNYEPNGPLLMRQVWVRGVSNPVLLSQELFLRYIPEPGDFYVVYEDGYASFSPRKAFLDGYTLDMGRPDSVTSSLRPAWPRSPWGHMRIT